jgi:carbonic anhydrase
MTEPTINLIDVVEPGQLVEIRKLFLEYADSLGFDLCFQNFDEELARLPGEYAPPGGRLILAEVDGAPAGCIAMKCIDSRTCEMKRLYVRPAFRSQGLGRRLSAHLIEEARLTGYRAMRLDTVPALDHAIALYRNLGFKEIAPYRVNPIPGALYMELELRSLLRSPE